ncbi:MAG: MCE family protein [Spirochaetes bacterium]|nr:MCE family protein [Spirochaetota bacterium]
MKNEIAVGLFFFLALAILSYFTIIMSGDIFETREYYKMTAIFQNVEGLDNSSKVKVNGVLSGFVEDVVLMPDNSILVKLKMYQKFVLYENYKIKVRYETMLGGRFVGIDPGLAFKDGKHYAIVESRANLKGEAMVDAIAELSDLIAENRPNIYKTIKNIKEITAKINAGQGTLGKLVNENKVYNNTDDLIKDLRETMEDAREQAPITSFIRAALLAF